MLSPPIRRLRSKNPQRQPLAVAGFCLSRAGRNRAPAQALLLRSASAIGAAGGTGKRGVMAGKSFETITRDLSEDFSALQADVRRLTAMVADLADDQGRRAQSRASDAADNVRDRFSGTVGQARNRFASTMDQARDRVADTADRFAGRASEVSGRVRGAGAEFEARVERNPLTAVMIAVVGGLLIGALSRSRR